MKYIKLFESFSKILGPGFLPEDKIKSNLEDIFVELVDNGFKIEVFTHLVNLEGNIELNFKKVNIEGGWNVDKSFKYKDIKEYVLMALDYIRTIWPDIIIEYRTERKVVLFGSKQYIVKHNEPTDDEEVVDIKMEIYKQ
jgi:hypothetical protein